MEGRGRRRSRAPVGAGGGHGRSEVTLVTCASPRQLKDRSWGWEGNTFDAEDIDAKFKREGGITRPIFIQNSDLPQMYDERGWDADRVHVRTQFLHQLVNIVSHHGSVL